MTDLSKLSNNEEIQFKEAKASLKEDLLKMPEFPHVRIDNRAFILSSNGLDGNWSAHYHSRSDNIKTILELIDTSSSVRQIKKRCLNVIDSGRYKREPINPITINVLRKWCKK